MDINEQILSPATRFDFKFTHKKMVAIVETKRAKLGGYATWWVSGLTRNGGPHFLGQFHMGIEATTERSAFESCKQISQTVFKLSSISADVGGCALLPEMQTPEIRMDLARIHIATLDDLGFLGSYDDLIVRTAGQYSICKSFNAGKAIELIASYEGVPTSTIQKRIARARDAGLIAKINDSRGRNA